MSALRPTRPTALFFTGAALSQVLGAVALAAAVLAAPTPARAADDDTPLDSRILRGLLESIGLQKEERIINYQERAPLVIPPSKTLPPPERSDAVIANNPAWPKDPDVLRAKEEAARERSAFTTADEQLRRDALPLRPDEMTPGQKPRGKVARTTQRPGSSSEFSDTGQRLTPSQLGYTGGLFGTMFGGTPDETAKFTGEPPRASLTEPPPGYQTPSPDQPYGLSERAKAPKATNYMLEHGTELPR
jgi:hypothetical protein